MKYSVNFSKMKLHKGKMFKDTPNAKVEDKADGVFDISFVDGGNSWFCEYVITLQYIYGFQIFYPTSQKQDYDLYIAQLSKSFAVPKD